MRVRRGVVAALVATTVTAVLGGPSVNAGPRTRAVVVGVDEAGDWGSNVFGQGAPLGDVLAQDLVEASIQMGDADTVHFVLRLNSLSAWGGVPEITRYVWELSVDGAFFMLDGKFTNYSRGVCDPMSGQCPAPRDPGLYPFIVHDGCQPSPAGMVCREIGLVHARFDPPSGTITVPVALELIQAEADSKIEAGRGSFFRTFGASVVAAPAVWRTCSPVSPSPCRGHWPIDGLTVTRSFTVPGRRGA